jgi:hypothetical protein
LSDKVGVTYIYQQILIDRKAWILNLPHSLEGDIKKAKAIQLHAIKALVGRGGIAPTHSRLGTRWG